MSDQGRAGRDGAAATHWRDGEPVSDRGDTVCVIGAGGSGLTAIKNLKESGFGVDCYERETSVGGAWNWRHDRSPVYSSTYLVSSRPTTQFPDFPMPDDWPDYLHHSRLLSYFERYADHFELRDDIWFGTEVVSVAPVDRPGGGPPRWDVTVRGSRGGAQRTMQYTAVIAANGHNWAPRMPEFEGLDSFRGEVIHASAYSDAKQVRGRKVLVVGGGNSGGDIAVDAAEHADRCWHSTRRGSWYLPRYALGRPVDQLNDRLLAMRLPLRVRQWLYRQVLRVAVGDLTRFGIRRPEGRVLTSRAIVNSSLVEHAGQGSVTPAPGITRFERNQVVFDDGSTATPDLVIMATGYLPRFEFLAPELLGSDDAGRPRLALQLFSRAYPTLAVAGLVEPDSGLFSIVHWQMVLFAQWLRLLETAPEAAAPITKRICADISRRYVEGKATGSSRYGFEVSHVVYLRAIEKTLREIEGVA